MTTVLNRPRTEAPIRGVRDPRSAAEIARETFLMGLAHDIRQALTVISGTVQLTERRIGAATMTLESVPAALEDIRDAADRLTAQVAELEHFATAQSDRVPALERGPVNLSTLAREMAARHAETSHRHRFSVITGDVDGGPIVGYWDGRKLERALDNLVGNALKFSPAGGNITINVGREATPVADGTDARVAVLQVRDEGVGIPAPELPHIFECFRRAENAARSFPGTGVGLALVEQIVQEHGGTVEAASELGHGSTFTLRLPLPVWRG